MILNWRCIRWMPPHNVASMLRIFFARPRPTRRASYWRCCGMAGSAKKRRYSVMSFTRESGVCEEFGYQAARRKACILLVSCRSVTNLVKMELLGVSKRNSGRLWRSAMATTSSEGGMPGRMVRSQEPKEFQTSRG